ncbi:MAG: hypothetical protein JWM21_2866 [Acidobacteria bacterium]|nr:hypothetical protein [Acidobacteriota bacterium]
METERKSIARNPRRRPGESPSLYTLCDSKSCKVQILVSDGQPITPQINSAGIGALVKHRKEHTKNRRPIRRIFPALAHRSDITYFLLVATRWPTMKLVDTEQLGTSARQSPSLAGSGEESLKASGRTTVNKQHLGSKKSSEPLTVISELPKGAAGT